jgi:N-acetylglutamate synthase-like GNAT family acetyltransferase
MRQQTFQAMIRKCSQSDFDEILEIINDGAQAYKGVIPADRWHEPYMSRSELEKQLNQEAVFWAYISGDSLSGVMGIQHVKDVTLIRHAYVRSLFQRQGIGSKLLTALCQKSDRPFLIGTWAAATWAIEFYQKHGFKLVPANEIPTLLNEYWSIPRRQVETSVVLGDNKWFAHELARDSR